MNKGLNCVQVPKTPPVSLIFECVVNCYTEKYLQETIIIREKAEIRASHEHPITEKERMHSSERGQR
jgi:hypothetical protein